MKKLRFNKPFLLTLITAFILLQWSSVHIHLAAEHEHNGNQHQHAANAHQHQLLSSHADAIDVAADTFSHTDSNKVVELEQVCTQFHGKPGAQLAALPHAYQDLPKANLFSSSPAFPDKLVIYQAYHQYTSIQLRAPPVFS